MARNGGFPAKFQRLYTRRTWRFLGWNSRDIVCCESSAFIFWPSSFIGAAVPARTGWSPGCARLSGAFTHPGGRGSPVRSAGSICAMIAALERGSLAGCERMPQRTDDLRAILVLLKLHYVCTDAALRELGVARPGTGSQGEDQATGAIFSSLVDMIGIQYVGPQPGERLLWLCRTAQSSASVSRCRHQVAQSSMMSPGTRPKSR